MLMLPAILERSVRQYPHQPALAASGADQIWSYHELGQQVGRWSNRLRALRLDAGDRVLLLLESSPDWVAGLFALWRAGLVGVPLTVNATPEVVQAATNWTAARAVIHSPQTAPLLSMVPKLQRLCVADTNATDDVIEDVEFSVNNSDSLALLGLTSGSTRQPRLVELTHGNLAANLHSLIQVRGGGPGDAMLCMLPAAHLFGLMVGVMAPLACGARAVFPGALLPNRLVNALREEHITHALSVPALAEAFMLEVIGSVGCAESGVSQSAPNNLLEAIGRLREAGAKAGPEVLRETLRARLGNSFQCLILGAAAVGPIWSDLERLLGLRIEVGYGLTEASPIVSLGHVTEMPPASVGRPVPQVQVRIGERGEILVKGPNVMRGYHRDAQATATALQSGWLRTGDYGTLDEQGFLFVIGRLKEALVTAAGETIYPEEAEPHYSSPLFVEYCVAGQMDANGNDCPTLFVVCRDDSISDQLVVQTFRDLRAAAPTRLRCERMIRLDQFLPRTPIGKVNRRQLTGLSFHQDQIFNA